MFLSIRAPSAHTSFLPSIPLRRHSAALLLRTPPPRRSPNFSTTITMSSTDPKPPQKIIEHFVLFKAKPSADPSAVSAMITNLNSLVSLPTVIHLSAAPVSRSRSNSLVFTHMLHSRYRSESDLVSYADHPSHVGVVSNFVKPVVEDVMAVDWVAEGFSGTEVVAPGSAVRLMALKLKDGVDKGEVLERMSGKERFGGSVGDNFSPGRAKGYSICSVEVFEGGKELEEVVDEEIKEFVDDVVVLDYTVVAEAPVQTATV